MYDTKTDSWSMKGFYSSVIDAGDGLEDGFSGHRKLLRRRSLQDETISGLRKEGSLILSAERSRRGRQCSDAKELEATSWPAEV